MNEKKLITKSDFQLFLDAPMHLWAHKHGQIQKRPSEFDIHIMNLGYEVEELARDYLREFASILIIKLIVYAHFLFPPHSYIIKIESVNYSQVLSTETDFSMTITGRHLTAPVRVNSRPEVFILPTLNLYRYFTAASPRFVPMLHPGK